MKRIKLTHFRICSSVLENDCVTVGLIKKQDIYRSVELTFKNLAPYIQDGRTTTLQMLHFMYFFSTNISTEYFKHAAHSPFFSSKCRLFYIATLFGSCIIYILHTRCAQIEI